MIKLHILSDLHNELVPRQPDPTAAAAADAIVAAQPYGRDGACSAVAFRRIAGCALGVSALA